MKRFVMGCTVAAAGLLLVAAPTWAQDGGAGARMPEDRARADQQRPGLQEEFRQAWAHFLAGFNTGYRAGYRDAANETVLFIIPGEQAEREARGDRAMAGRPGGPMDRMQMEPRRPGPMRPEGRRPQVELTGRVVRTKEVDLRGADRKHLVVLLQTREGRWRVVDLGRLDRLEKLDIREGDRITVRGRPVMVGDRTVLRAERIEAGDQVVRQRYTRPRTFVAPQDRAAARPREGARWY